MRYQPTGPILSFHYDVKTRALSLRVADPQTIDGVVTLTIEPAPPAFAELLMEEAMQGKTRNHAVALTVAPLPF